MRPIFAFVPICLAVLSTGCAAPPNDERAAASPTDRVESATIVDDSAEFEPTARSLAAVTTAFPSVDAMCSDYVESAKASLEARLAAFMIADLRPRTPTCVAIDEAPRFFPAAAFRSLSTVAIDDGILSQKALVIETARGFSIVPIVWDESDPSDPGCAMIVRPTHVDSVYVDRGHLVVLLAAGRAAYVEPTSSDDDGFRAALVKTAAWCTDQDGHLQCEQLQTAFGTFLGMKVAARGHVDWDAIPWADDTLLTFDDSSRVKLVR